MSTKQILPDKLFIEKLDKTWEHYVHSQNTEIYYLWLAVGAAKRLLDSLKSCNKYHEWRKEHDPR